MAESTLSPDINTLRREVGVFMGWGRDYSAWDTDQENDFLDISKRAQRMYYFPPTNDQIPYFEWTFLHKTGTITLATNDVDYDLPDDFGGTVLDDTLTYADASNNRTLRKIDESDIRKNQALDSIKGIPKYFAIRNKAHAPATGQRWEALFYPTPSSAANNLVITYRYVYVPDATTNTNIYVAGGAQYGETVLAAYLAAAELRQDNEPGGPYHQDFMNKLSNAMRNDANQKQRQSTGVP